jgi:hypothetical protein
MLEVHREITSFYRIDGIFSNRWEGSGMCYCEHCRSNFHAATGLELPRTADPQGPSRRAYIEWRQQRLFTLWRLWDSEIRKINPAACFIPTAGGGVRKDKRAIRGVADLGSSVSSTPCPTPDTAFLAIRQVATEDGRQSVLC